MSKKLLLADDSITIQKVIQITFAHEDYELTITDNGDSALTKAREIKPDLVMADVYMPGKNGYELASAIKHDPLLQHVPVLLLAGSFEPFDEEKARSCKADAWIEKPFESQGLIDKVAELLSTARQAPEPVAPVAGPLPVATTVESAVFAEEPSVLSAEPAMAAVEEDPFGDISFEDEVSAVEPAFVSYEDDRSDIIAEPVAARSAFEDDFAMVGELPEDDFSFSEEESVITDFPPAEVPAAAMADFDAFDMDDDEIMPLGDDDILGEEDLEPVMQEQTLAAWSRDETEGEDAFVESLTEIPADEDESTFAPSVETAIEESPAFDEPVDFAEPVPFSEPVTEGGANFGEVAVESDSEEISQATYDEPEPVPVAANMTEVANKAAVMSEEELERIIEKVVAKVIEKLADSIVERVAWEVVPDLAEKMIREEIRKIKDAAA